jgi:hypothetical protein
MRNFFQINTGYPDIPDILAAWVISGISLNSVGQKLLEHTTYYLAGLISHIRYKRGTDGNGNFIFSNDIKILAK